MFAVLLHRYSGQQAINIGTPVARRNQPEIENIYGCFINTLVLQTNLSGDPTIVELVKKVRQICLDAFANQDVPFERVVDVVNPERNSSLTPLFQAMFIYHVQDTRKVDQLGDIGVTPCAVHGNGSKFDITLELTDTGSDIRGFIEFRTELFKQSTIERMAGHFVALLEAACQTPELPVSGLPLMSDDERRQLLIDWNHLPPAIDTDSGVDTSANSGASAPGAVAAVATGAVSSPLQRKLPVQALMLDGFRAAVQQYSRANSACSGSTFSDLSAAG